MTTEEGASSLFESFLKMTTKVDMATKQEVADASIKDNDAKDSVKQAAEKLTLTADEGAFRIFENFLEIANYLDMTAKQAYAAKESNEAKVPVKQAAEDVSKITNKAKDAVKQDIENTEEGASSIFQSFLGNTNKLDMSAKKGAAEISQKGNDAKDAVKQAAPQLDMSDEEGAFRIFENFLQIANYLAMETKQEAADASKKGNEAKDTVEQATEDVSKMANERKIVVKHNVENISKMNSEAKDATKMAEEAVST